MRERFTLCKAHNIPFPSNGRCPICARKPARDPPLKIIQMVDMGDGLAVLTDDGRLFHGNRTFEGDFEWIAEITPDVNRLRDLPNIAKQRI